MTNSAWLDTEAVIDPMRRVNVACQINLKSVGNTFKSIRNEDSNWAKVYSYLLGPIYKMCSALHI